MLGHWRHLLEEVVENPERRIGELALLEAAEQQRLKELSQGVRQAWSQDSCLHDLVSRRAQQCALSTAVVCGDERLSYAELELRANGLAHQLRTCGVGPEERVGICLERGVEMVVAVLAVLKAGGAYLPLDPAYPAERIAFLLKDARPAVILSQASLRDRLEQTGARLLLSEQWEPARPEAPRTGVTAANLAYVIYTSGSTGQPKAVMVDHRSAVSLVELGNEDSGIQPMDRILFVTSLCLTCRYTTCWACWQPAA